MMVICLISGVALSVYLVNRHVLKEAGAYTVTVESAPHADAALVLGAQVFKGGGVSLILRDRLDTGIALYKAHKTPKLLLSGDHGHVSYDEVNTMRRYALARGVRDEDIFMDHAGFSTYESAYRTRDIFKVKKVIIVTQSFHLPRALFIARKLGLTAYGVASDKRDYREKSYNDLRETAARYKDFFTAAVFKPKPTFLGKTIPIQGDGRATADGK